MDTILGINNEGTLEFEPFVEWGDTKPTGGNVYNGQNQLFWQLFIELYGDKIAQTYKQMRAGNFNLEYLNNQYDEFQKAWGERLYNEDAEFSYIQPFLELGDESYFEMAQGMKTSQRHYFLRNRLDYLDSKFNAGNAIANACTVRGYQANNLKVSYNMPIYASIKYGSQLIQQRVQTANTETEIPIPTGMTINDTETYIYSCDRLTSIDGLADYQIGYADFSKAINLQTLNIGKHDDPEYSNTHFNMLRLGNNKLLETLDCGGCTGLTGNIDVSGCSNLNTAYFNRTGITGITLPTGDSVKHIWLPDTLRQLKVVNQNIPDFNWNDGACAWNSLTQCWLENSVLQYDGMDIDIAYAIVNGDFQSGCYVRFIGYDFYLQNGTEATAFANTIATLHGIDERGQLVDNAVISGDIYIEEPMSMTAYNRLVELMPYVTIHAEIRPAIVLNMTTETSENDEDDPTTTTQSVELYSFTDYEEPTIIEEDVQDLSQYRLKANGLSTGFSLESNASKVAQSADYLKYQSTKLSYGLKYSGITLTKGHKYYFCLEIKTPVDAKLSIFQYESSGNFDSVADTWQLIHMYKTGEGASITGYFDYITSTGSSPYIAEVRNLRIYDLTAQYGAGNEPTEAECVEQGCFLKKTTITGTTVTQEIINASANVAQLMFPNGKQIIQDTVDIYKSLNECNYSNLLSEYLGEVVYEDIEIDATQYRKKVSSISRNIMYCSQSTHRETLIPNLTLDQMKTITVNDSRLANHVNYDDPTESVPKPMAFSITKTNVREYTSEDSFDLTTLTDELIFSEYPLRQWNFDTYDIRFDVYAIYNESIIQLLYGINITGTPPKFNLADILTWDASKILRTIYIPHGSSSSPLGYSPDYYAYFVDLDDEEIVSAFETAGIMNKNSQYIKDKYGANSNYYWNGDLSWEANQVYHGVIPLYDTQNEEYVAIRFVARTSFTTYWYAYVNYVYTTKQIFEPNNVQGWYLDNSRYKLVNIMQQTPMSYIYDNSLAGYAIQDTSSITYYPVSHNAFNMISYGSASYPALESVGGIIASGWMASSSGSTVKYTLSTPDLILNTVRPIVFKPKRAWIIPVDINSLVQKNISSLYTTISSYPITGNKIQVITDALGGINEYTMKFHDNEFHKVIDLASFEFNYASSDNIGANYSYFMGFSGAGGAGQPADNEQGSQQRTFCAETDFVIASRAIENAYYAKKGFSTYSLDEDMPTLNNVPNTEPRLSIIPLKSTLNYVPSPTNYGLPIRSYSHIVKDNTIDNIFALSMNFDYDYVYNKMLTQQKYRLWNTFKTDYRKGERLILGIKGNSTTIGQSANIYYGDGTTDKMRTVPIVVYNTDGTYSISIDLQMPTNILLHLRDTNSGEFVTKDITEYVWVQSNDASYAHCKLTNYITWQEDYINGYNTRVHEVVGVSSSASASEVLRASQFIPVSKNSYFSKSYSVDVVKLRKDSTDDTEFMNVFLHYFPSDSTGLDEPDDMQVEFIFGNGRQSIPITGSYPWGNVTYNKTTYSLHNIPTSALAGYSVKPNEITLNAPMRRGNTNYAVPAVKPSPETGILDSITANGYVLHICPKFSASGTLNNTSVIDTGMSYALIFGIYNVTDWTVKKGVMYFTIYPSDDEKYGVQYRYNMSSSSTIETLPRLPVALFNCSHLIDCIECVNGTTTPKSTDNDTIWQTAFTAIPRINVDDAELEAMRTIQDYRGIESMMNNEDGIYGDFSFGMWNDFKSLADTNTYGLDSFNACTYEQFKSVFLM